MRHLAFHGRIAGNMEEQHFIRNRKVRIVEMESVGSPSIKPDLIIKIFWIFMQKAEFVVCSRNLTRDRLHTGDRIFRWNRSFYLCGSVAKHYAAAGGKRYCI